jgi:hypothetical protein
MTQQLTCFQTGSMQFLAVERAGCNVMVMVMA